MSRSLSALSLVALAAPALAGGQAFEHRLSPAEVERVLTAAADKHLADERATGVAPVDVLEPLRGPRAVAPLDLHGSVGVSVGTHGYRSAYGSAVVGLGGTSSVAISVERGEGESNRWIVP